MKVIDHIKAAKDETLFSIEILPPLRGQSIHDLFNVLEPLMDFKPPFMDVTYHREEYIYKEHDNGLLEKVMTRKRPGTVAICAALQNRFQVDAVPHIICGGFSKEDTEDALIDLNFLGIDNVLALRGDALKTDGKFIPHPDGNVYATDLIQQIMELNEGQYLHDSVKSPVKTNFSVGVAVYPEKHFEAPNLDSDLEILKKKIELGAEYAVTQMFFDNQKYFDFVDKVRAEGIDIPIIPGLKPLVTERHLSVLPSIFHLDLPAELVKRIEACKGDKKKIKEEGILWCIQQSKELKERGVPVLHYYTMSKSDVILKVASQVF